MRSTRPLPRNLHSDTIDEPEWSLDTPMESIISLSRVIRRARHLYHLLFPTSGSGASLLAPRKHGRA